MPSKLMGCTQTLHGSGVIVRTFSLSYGFYVKIQKNEVLMGRMITFT